MARKASNIVEDMNEATLQAMREKEEQLAKIPPPEFRKDIHWPTIIQSMGFNTRSEESYAKKNNMPLYYSLKNLGLQMRGADNMSFSLRDDTHLLALSGNLRYTMMSVIRDEEAADRLKNGIETTPDNPLPFEYIFGLVFENLTEDQEIALMADHTMKKGLNEAELTKEVAVFYRASGLTYAKASIKFGMDHNKIRRMVYRYSMPTVFREFEKQHSSEENVSFYPITHTSLDVLYEAYLKDQRAGCDYRQEGINFRNAWNTFTSTPNDKGVKKAAPKSLPRETIVEQIGTFGATFGNTPEVEKVADILTWASNGTKNGFPVSMQSAMVDLTEYCNGMRDTVEKANETIESLRLELQETKELLAQLQVEYDASVALNEELQTTLKTVTSDNVSGD